VLVRWYVVVETLTAAAAAAALLDATATADVAVAAAALDGLVDAWRFSRTGMAGIWSAVFVGRTGGAGPGAPARSMAAATPRGYPDNVCQPKHSF